MQGNHKQQLKTFTDASVQLAWRWNTPTEITFQVTRHSPQHGNAKLQTVSWRIQPNLDEATKESEPYIMHLADRGGFPGKAEYELGKKPINRSNIQARSGAVPVVILPDGTYLKDT